MKIAFLKIGARLAFGRNDTSAGNGEARDLMMALNEAGADIHIYTKILKGDVMVPEFTFHNILDDYKDFNSENFDAIIVMNGNLNFFGGAELPEGIVNYHIINHFPGRVFYVLCDPALSLKQTWGAIEGKPWAGNWNKSDIYIERDDIVYLSQSYNLDVVKKKILNKGKQPVVIKDENVVFYPFHYSPCIKDRLPFNENPEWDLSYGGTQRGGKRDKKLAKFYYGYDDDIKVQLFGKIKHEKFDTELVEGQRPPEFGKAIKHAEMQQRMNNSIAHVCVGDKIYEELNIISQRVSESIWANTVCFIDEDFDSKRLIFQYGDDSLRDFLYVKDRADVQEKIRKLKADPELRKQILDQQVHAYGYNKQTFGQNLIDTMKAFK